jgi:WD40 repeat protein
VSVWNGETGALTHSLRGHTLEVTCLLAFQTPEGPWRLLSGADDCTVKVRGT